jgi:hypothetical protein
MAEAYAKRKGEAVGGSVSRGRSSSFEECPLLPLMGTLLEDEERPRPLHLSAIRYPLSPSLPICVRIASA